MAIFYKLTNTNGGEDWSITEGEAKAKLEKSGEDGKIERVIVDDVEARQYAALWLNYCERMRQRAIKREANKTAKERSDNAKKAWATRRANQGED